MKSYKPEVVADGSGNWCSNATRFATKEEAEQYVRDLRSRWIAVRNTRVVETDDAVTYVWVDNRAHPIPDAAHKN